MRDFYTRVGLFAFVLWFFTAITHAQESSGAVNTKHYSYDAVSIKRSAPNQTVRVSVEQNALRFSNIDLGTLIASAYNTRTRYVYGLPKWVQEEHYDIYAKVTDADSQALSKLTPADRAAMLRELLAEYFHLLTHMENRELRVYALSCKTTPCLLKTEDATAKALEGYGAGMVLSNTGDLRAKGISMDSLAMNLGDIVEKPVVNRTGLTGTYDIFLRWRPEDSASLSKEAGSSENYPDLMTAIQEQVGLRLTSDRASIPVLVVDALDQAQNR